MDCGTPTDRSGRRTCPAGPSWRRRLATLAGFVVVTTLTPACATGSLGDAACPVRLSFRETIYYGYEIERDVPLGRLLPDAIRPVCEDGNSEGDQPEAVVISAIRGVRPAVAFTTTDRPRHVYWPRERDHPPTKIRKLVSGW